MAISNSKTDREWKSIIESTETSGQPARAVVNPDGSNIGGGLEYNATSPTLTDGDKDSLQGDASGNLKTTSATKIAGEDLTNDVMKVEGQFSLSYKASAGANQVVKASEGYLKGIILGTWVDDATLEVSDHASDGDGNVLIFLTGDTTDSVDHGYPKYIPVEAVFSTGITADITAFTNVTFIYR